MFNKLEIENISGDKKGYSNQWNFEQTKYQQRNLESHQRILSICSDISTGEFYLTHKDKKNLSLV